MSTRAARVAVRAPVPWSGIGHLVVLYLVWGSTYFAIRVAVRPEGGFPPFTLGAMRVATAGTLLLAGAALARLPLRPTARELAVLAASGVLLWLGGNGLVVFAETRADSGYAALLIAATPIWVTAMESAIDRRWPSWRLVAALLLGLGGIAVLSGPRLMQGGAADWIALVSLVSAGLLWGSGLVLQQRRPVSLHPVVSAAYQQLFGAVAFAVVARLAGEPLPRPSGEAWVAWSYLTTLGSVVAFTSFVFAVRLLPASLVTTYAYVNPVLAVLLGTAFLGEPLTGWTVAGAALVLLAVAGVFRERGRLRRIRSG